MTPPKSNSVSISKCSKYKKSEHKRIGSPPCPPTNTLWKIQVLPLAQESSQVVVASEKAPEPLQEHHCILGNHKKSLQREELRESCLVKQFFVKFRIHLAIHNKILFSLKFPQWLRNYFQISPIFSRKSRSSSTVPVYSKNLTTVMKLHLQKVGLCSGVVLDILSFSFSILPPFTVSTCVCIDNTHINSFFSWTTLDKLFKLSLVRHPFLLSS